METQRESYAWVKTVKDEEAGPVSATCTEPRCSEREGELYLMSGDRPPFEAAALQETLQKLTTVIECCDAGHKRTIASSVEHGSWSVDAIYGGHSGISFEVLQFVGPTREDAIKWLRTPAGVAWCANAQHVALLRHEGPADDSRATDPASLTGLALPPGISKFREEDWRSDYLRVAKQRINNQDLWLNEHDLQPLWSGLEQAVGDALSDAANERGQFPAAALTSDEIRRIRAESSDIAALRTVMAGAPDANLLDKPNTMQLLERVRQETRPFTFALKLCFGRGRPWQELNPPALAIQPGEPLFPAHAAFPAGHAVLVYTLAGLLTHTPPVAGVDYLERAQVVAWNRVKGGFHWPSDLTFSRFIADGFVGALTRDRRMLDLLTKVRDEW